MRYSYVRPLEEKEKPPPGPTAVRRRLFRLALVLEAFGLAFVLFAGFGLAIVAAFVVLLAAGLVLAGLCSLGRPRYRPAVISLYLHAAALVLIYGSFAVRDAYAHFDGQVRTRREYEKRKQQQQREELAQLLLKNGTEAGKAFLREHEDLEIHYNRPLTQALCPPNKATPDIELLRVMLVHGAPSNGDLLVEAAKCSLKSVKAVMSLGIPATAVSKAGRTALTKAKDIDLLRFLLKQGVKVDARDNNGATALMYHRNEQVTRFLLAHGADAKAVDNERRTALHYSGGDPKRLAAIFELLLEAGADPNARDFERRNDTPLLAMATYELWNQPAADVLVRHGADPYALSGGDSALSAMAGHGYFPRGCLQWPNIDLAGEGGANLLTAALEGQHFDLVRELLELGANPTVSDRKGVSALDFANERWRGEDRGSDSYQAILRASERVLPPDAAPDAAPRR